MQTATMQLASAPAMLVASLPSLAHMRSRLQAYRGGDIQPLQYFVELEQAVVQWAESCNITKAGGATVVAQWCKTIEELGELAGALVRGHSDKAEDGIGDILVTLIIQRHLLGLPQFSATLASINLHTSFAPPKTVMESGWLHTAIDSLALYLVQYRGYEESESRAGNTLYALSRLANSIGCSLHECLYSAVVEILPRKGRMVDGVFIKEEPVGMEAEDGVCDVLDAVQPSIEPDFNN